MEKIHALIREASDKCDMWVQIANNPSSLESRGKTRTQALALANFFEGRYDGLCDAMRIMKEVQDARPEQHA